MADHGVNLQIGCVKAYLNIMEWCQRHSNWLDKSADPYFPPSAVHTPWEGIEDLRQRLFSQQKLWSCHTILRYEEKFTDQKIYLARVEEFIIACEKSDHAITESVSLLIVLAKLYFAELLINAGKPDHVGGLLDWVHGQIQSGFIVKNYPNGGVYYQRFYKKLRKVQSPTASVQDKIEQLIEVIEEADTDQDLLMELTTLADVFFLFGGIPVIDRSPKLRELQEFCEKRYLNISSSGKVGAVFTSSAIAHLGYIMSRDFGKEEVVLNAVKEFEIQFPQFCLPHQDWPMYLFAARIARQRGDFETAHHYDENVRIAGLNGPNVEASTGGSWQYTGPAKADPWALTREYRLQHSSQWARPLLAIVIDWIKHELQEGLLDAKEAWDLLCLDGLSGQFNGDPCSTIHPAASLITILNSLDPANAAANLFGHPKPVSFEAWTVRLHRIEQWLKLPERSTFAEVRHTILGDLQNARVGSVQNHSQEQTLLDIENNGETGNFDHHLYLERQVLLKLEVERHLAVLKSLHPKAAGTDKDSILSAEWQVVSQALNLSHSREAVERGIITDADLLRGQLWMEDHLTTERLAGPMLNELMMSTISCISSFRWQRYILFGTQTPENRLSILRELDDLLVSLRRQKTALKGWKLVNARTGLTDQMDSFDHYYGAIGAIFESLGASRMRDAYHSRSGPTRYVAANAENMHLFAELIAWTQKLKARAVVESLGAGIIIPSSILQRLDPDSESMQMLLRESGLELRASDSLAAQVETQRDLDDLRAAIRKDPDLEIITSIREGISLDSTQIKSFCEELGPGVVILDWLYLPFGHTGHQSELLPMVYRDGQLVQAFFTETITYKDVQAWVEEYMHEQDHSSMLSERGTYGTETPEELLHRLDALVAPLETFSRPGEVVILSPTNLMHRVPLHALHVQGQALIERNPVVYTQSLSMLRMCRVLAEQRDSSQEFKAIITETLSSSDTMRPSMNFANDIGTLVFKDDLLSKDVFLEVASEADLLHFHGHVRFQENAPLDHSLNIKGEEEVTARDIFDLKLNSGSHVTLIGCSSGRARISSHDDLLGLSMAFHYAGASSITSTLWNIDKADGAEFQEAFYRDLLNQQSSAPENELLNLATAMQSAILELRKDEKGPPGSVRSPYHWAGFVLHGYWKFPRLPVRSHSPIERPPDATRTRDQSLVRSMLHYLSCMPC
jgi:CHAT domain-containing protein